MVAIINLIINDQIDKSSNRQTKAEPLKRALLLGMVYTKQANPSRGQGYRDMVRCEALEERGYIVETFDNKHEEILAKDGRHCRGSFSDFKRMIKSMTATWKIEENDPPRYDVIILDYFFSPAGWVNERWKESFFSETIPGFVHKNLLKITGALWLPNNLYVNEMVVKYANILSEDFNWSLMKPTDNPLYQATDDVKDQLMKCPDILTNENQIISTGQPFICFKPKLRLESKSSIHV